VNGYIFCMIEASRLSSLGRRQQHALARTAEDDTKGRGASDRILAFHGCLSLDGWLPRWRSRRRL